MFWSPLLLFFSLQLNPGKKIIVNFALTLKVRRKNFNIISTFGYYIKLKIHSGAPLVFTDQTTGTFIRFLLPHLLGSVIEKL